MYRTLVTKELAELFSVLSHPIRIRIIEELKQGEQDVSSLASLLEISQSGVSQHLSLLRIHKLIIERKEGRKVFYHLRNPELASWVLEGLSFAAPEKEEVELFLSAIEKARATWAKNPRSNFS